MKPLGEALIRAGYFFDQARALLESSKVDGEGNIACASGLGRRQAPQLMGVLSYWPDVQIRPNIRIPNNVVNELNAVWALLPPPPVAPPWEAERRAVGQRAEMYSYQVEREQANDPSKVIWVAQDDDSLGWDIENRCSIPPRHIEVKGSRRSDIVFFLSRNELERAKDLKESYEVHFWGCVDLLRRPEVEYAALRDIGYPVVVPNVAKALDEGHYQASADRWRVEKA